MRVGKAFRESDGSIRFRVQVLAGQMLFPRDPQLGSFRQKLIQLPTSRDELVSLCMANVLLKSRINCAFFKTFILKPNPND